MPSLFYGMLAQSSVPQDEEKVRATADVYEMDTPAAMQEDMPVRNEVDTDHNPDLTGLASRQKASLWVAPVKSAPFWKGQVDTQVQHNLMVDEQVSTSGTAAAREAAGQFGHGTMAYAVGIEPVADLTDGGKMGNEYFKRNDRDIQATSDNTMMSIPPGYDQSVKGRVAAEGKINARESAMAAMYNTWWNGGN